MVARRVVDGCQCADDGVGRAAQDRQEQRLGQELLGDGGAYWRRWPVVVPIETVLAGGGPTGCLSSANTMIASDADLTLDPPSTCQARRSIVQNGRSQVQRGMSPRPANLRVLDPMRAVVWNPERPHLHTAQGSVDK